MARVLAEFIRRLSGSEGWTKSTFGRATDFDRHASTIVKNSGGPSGWKLPSQLPPCTPKRLRVGWYAGTTGRASLTYWSQTGIQMARFSTTISLSFPGGSSNGRAWYRCFRLAASPHLHRRRVAARPGLFPSARVDTSNRTASHRKA